MDTKLVLILVYPYIMVEKPIKLKGKIKMDKITITRKYALIPTKSYKKEWNKKVCDFTLKDLEHKIEYFEQKLKKTKSKDEKQKIKNRIAQIEEYLENLNNTLEENPKSEIEFTQKMINDYTYNLVRTAMEEESRRKNYILSWMFAEMTLNGVQYMESLRDKYKFISDTINYAYRVKGSKKGSLFDNTELSSILGGYGITFSQELTKKIKEAVKDGLLEGKITLPMYKLDSPFTIAKAHMGFSHDYDSYEELCEHVNDKDLNLYFDYGTGPSIARFKINLGHGKNKDELKTTLLRLYSGEYEYCGSSIQISKSKIILNLTMSIPKKIKELDENTVVGVDLGLAVPAMCALNNNVFDRESIGSADDFLEIRKKIRNQRRRLQENLKKASGGHGRRKKLKALDRFSKYEKHWVQSYNHYVSKSVVDFALKNNAKYINIENLQGNNENKNNFILSNWSYYQLQQYITYKAEKYGIEVRKINPCYTSQVCSVCGNWHPENRPKGDKGQAYFECHNEECASHSKKAPYQYGINADFNAARNIAMSTLFMESGKVTEKSKQEAREYYGIEEEYEELNREKKNKEVA